MYGKTCKKPIKCKNSRRITEYELEEWKRVVLNPLFRIYGWTLVVEIFVFCIYQPTDQLSKMEYFREYVVLPLLYMMLVIAVLYVFFAKLAVKMKPAAVAVVAIVLLNLYAGINICIFNNLKYMMVAVFLPIVMAPIYKEKKLVYLQVVISLGILLFCELWYTPGHVQYLEENVIVDVAVMLLLFYAMVKFELEVVISTDMLGMQSSRDSLTHLFNHEAFYEALDDQMSRFTQTKEPFSIIIGDIDNFKKVNDTYGHAFGDEVIKKVAEVILTCRGTRDLCARYGGEEFSVILPNKNLNDAVLQAEKIRKKFEETEFQTEDGQIHHFSISLGVAEYNREHRTASAFFELADKALYEAKGSGKNNVRCSR